MLLRLIPLQLGGKRRHNVVDGLLTFGARYTWSGRRWANSERALGGVCFLGA